MLRFPGSSCFALGPDLGAAECLWLSMAYGSLGLPFALTTCQWAFDVQTGDVIGGHVTEGHVI